jgi:hypothetical protein
MLRLCCPRSGTPTHDGSAIAIARHLKKARLSLGKMETFSFCAFALNNMSSRFVEVLLKLRCY